MKDKLTELIEWMGKTLDGTDATAQFIMAKAKSLQQETNDGKLYTQEEMDNAKGESYWEGWDARGES